MNTRQAKAREIATRAKILRAGDHVYLVPSQSANGHYRVEFNGADRSCTCDDLELTARDFKHVTALQVWIKNHCDGVPQQPGLGQKIPRPTYAPGALSVALHRHEGRESLEPVAKLK